MKKVLTREDIYIQTVKQLRLLQYMAGAATVYMSCFTEAGLIAHHYIVRVFQYVDVNHFVGVAEEHDAIRAQVLQV